MYNETALNALADRMLQGARQGVLRHFEKARDIYNASPSWQTRTSSGMSGWLSDQDIKHIESGGNKVNVSVESGELFYSITFK